MPKIARIYAANPIFYPPLPQRLQHITSETAITWNFLVIMRICVLPFKPRPSLMHSANDFLPGYLARF